MDIDNYHNLLFPYAYNILGSVEDAKDTVQEVMTNYFSSENKNIENKKGYLIKGVINRSINNKKKNIKTQYEGIWLPEPIATDRTDSNINFSEIVSYSLLILLEKLNPKERAVFILKEAFEYSHLEISEILSTTIENSRKLLSRARLNLKNRATKQPKKTNKFNSSYLENFVDIIRRKDFKSLEKLLNEDIKVASDGGGKVSVIRNILILKEHIIKFLNGVFHKYHLHSKIIYSEMNHQPAVLFYRNEKLYACMVVEINQEHSNIQAINFILNPDKLNNL